MTWKPDMRPVMISDDIVFVGGTPVSVHCLTTNDGLLLLDTGYPGMLEGIEENMNALGLDLQQVKYILHSHGHVDHYGSTAEIVRRTGAKTYIGREDADIVTGRLDLSWAKELGIAPAKSFLPDELFVDGSILQVGGRTIRCVHAPGHTAGTYAFFIDTYVDGQPMVAAMHGGVGINSMTSTFLKSYGLPLSVREEFRQGLHLLAREAVDIVLGNHPQQNDMEGKLVRLHLGKNPFVNADEWAEFLQVCERNLIQLLEDEKDD